VKKEHVDRLAKIFDDSGSEDGEDEEAEEKKDRIEKALEKFEN